MATVPLIADPQEVTDYLVDLLKREAGPLGLAYVGDGDRLVPRYPAAIVVSGAKEKILDATRAFTTMFEAEITVLHARLDKSHSTRLREDNVLTRAIEVLVDSDMNWGNRVIQAWVSSINPGVLLRPKGEQVVGTRMIVTARSRERF